MGLQSGKVQDTPPPTDWDKQWEKAEAKANTLLHDLHIFFDNFKGWLNNLKKHYKGDEMKAYGAAFMFLTEKVLGKMTEYKDANMIKNAIAINDLSYVSNNLSGMLNSLKDGGPDAWTDYKKYAAAIQKEMQPGGLLSGLGIDKELSSAIGAYLPPKFSEADFSALQKSSGSTDPKTHQNYADFINSMSSGTNLVGSTSNTMQTTLQTQSNNYNKIIGAQGDIYSELAKMVQMTITNASKN